MGSKAYRSQYGENVRHVIGDDEGFVAFVVGRYAGSALLASVMATITLCHILAALVFRIAFSIASERQGRFSGSTGFEMLITPNFVFQVFGEFIT